MAAALIISFMLTALVVPLLAHGIVDFGKFHDPAHGRETWLRRGHGRALRALFAHPLLIAVGVLVLAGAGYLAYGHVGTGFLPRMDEGGFVLDYQTAPGTSLTETNRELQQVEAILHRDPYVDTYSRRTGAGLGGDLKESYQGDFFVRLKSSGPRPPIWQVMDAITKEVTSRVPGINFDTHQLLSDMIGDMVGRPQPVVIELSAKNPDVLGNVAPQVAAAIAKIPGIEPASVNDGVVPAGDALEIRVAAAPATLEGMTPAEIEGQVYHYLNGAVVTRYLGAVQAVGVRLWLDPSEQPIYRDQLGQLPIRSSDGHVFPLQTVARISFVAGQPEITRDNLAQVVAITAQIGGGKDLGSTIAAVQQALHRPGLLPADVYYTIGGAYKQQQMAVAGMIKVFAAAAIAELVLLLFLYERFWLPVIIIVQLAGVEQCGFYRSVADRGRAQHHRDDGHGDDRRHRHRNGDLSGLRISPAGTDHAAAPGALRSRAQPAAADHHEHLGDDPGAGAAGCGDQRLGRPDAAATGDRDHRRDHRPAAIGIAGDAGGDRPDRARAPRCGGKLRSSTASAAAATSSASKSPPAALSLFPAAVTRRPGTCRPGPSGKYPAPQLHPGR